MNSFILPIAVALQLLLDVRLVSLGVPKIGLALDPVDHRAFVKKWQDHLDVRRLVISHASQIFLVVEMDTRLLSQILKLKLVLLANYAASQVRYGSLLIVADYALLHIGRQLGIVDKMRMPKKL